MSERNEVTASSQAQQQSAMSSQETLPAYTDGNAAPPYKPHQPQPKPSKMATLKHILKGDAHKNHMAALEAAASSSGIPKKDKTEKQPPAKSSSQPQNNGRTPTWKLIATGEVHKYNPRFRTPGL